MATAELRIGVIGAGRWANMAHLPGWKRDARCELVAVCDVSQQAADEAARTFEIPNVTGDYRRLLERDDIDVVDVVTGDSDHFEITMAALEAGKHVLCEKPVAYDFRETCARARPGAAKGLKTKLGLHVPLQPGGALHEGADRRGLRRHAVHLQRLRAELAVARPADAAAPGSVGRRDRPDPQSPRSKATARRSSTSATGGWAPT